MDPDDQKRRFVPRSLRVTAIIGFCGFLLILAGLAVAMRPVRTPLQDCGSAAAFLLDGRTHRLIDPTDPPEGTTEAQIDDHNTHPCQERAANRARPGAILIASGVIVIGATASTETVLRWRRRRRESARLE